MLKCLVINGLKLGYTMLKYALDEDVCPFFFLNDRLVTKEMKNLRASELNVKVFKANYLKVLKAVSASGVKI